MASLPPERFGIHFMVPKLNLAVELDEIINSFLNLLDVLKADITCHSVDITTIDVRNCSVMLQFRRLEPKGEQDEQTEEARPGS